MMTRPVWAEISRSRLRANYRILKSLAAPSELLSIVKANAYGHGNVACAQVLADEGAEWLGVTCVDEGITVRAACPGARILVMSGIWQRDEAEAAIAHRLTPVVSEPIHLQWLHEASGNAEVSAHLEIDTGMSRQGVRLEALPALLQRFDIVKLEGVMTHFHSPEVLSGQSVEAQLRQFVTALDTISEHGLRPQWIHAGNSSTVLTGNGANEILELAARYGAKAMLRPGLSLYGYAPRFTGNGALSQIEELQPVLAWKTRIVSLRTIETDETAGYNATFRAARTSKLALLPAGYADGLNRQLSNRGAVLVRGQHAPIAGRISMDLTIVDVTDIPGVEIGDEVVLIGEQGSERITAYDHADTVQTIPYEILCNISARVSRIMKD
jgi:alanine racemase